MPEQSDEPTQKSPDELAKDAGAKVWSNPTRPPHDGRGEQQAEQQAAIDPKFRAVLDELDAKAQKVVEGKDVSVECELLLKANMALGRLVTENVTLLVMQLADIKDTVTRINGSLCDLREGLKGGREVNAGRMSLLLARIDVLEDTLRGKMELNQREVMSAVGVVENAAAQAVCRAWDRRPLNIGGGGGAEGSGGSGGGGGAPAEPDYHDKAPGI